MALAVLWLLIALRVLGERLLLRLPPVFIEATLALGSQVLRPDASEGSQAARRLDVSDHADGANGRGFENSNRLDDVLLHDFSVLELFPLEVRYERST